MAIETGSIVRCERLGKGDFKVIDSRGSGALRELRLESLETREVEWIYEAHCRMTTKQKIQQARRLNDAKKKGIELKLSFGGDEVFPDTYVELVPSDAATAYIGKYSAECKKFYELLRIAEVFVTTKRKITQTQGLLRQLHGKMDTAECRISRLNDTLFDLKLKVKRISSDYQ